MAIQTGIFSSYGDLSGSSEPDGLKSEPGSKSWILKFGLSEKASPRGLAFFVLAGMNATQLLSMRWTILLVTMVSAACNENDKAGNATEATKQQSLFERVSAETS